MRAVTGTLARSAAGTFSLKVGGTAIAFVTHAVLTNLLGATSYGKYVFALAWVNVFVLGGLWGFNTAAVRYVAEYVSHEHWGLLRGFTRYSRGRVLQASVIAGLALAAAGLLWVDRRDHELLYALCAGGALVPLWAAVQLLTATLQGLQKVMLAQVPLELVRNLGLLIGVLVGIAALGATAGAGVVMGINLLATLVAFMVAVAFVRRHRPTQMRVATPVLERKEWSGTAGQMLLISGFNLVLFQADTIMIGALAGMAEAGIYAVASKVASLLVFALAAINAVISPVAARLHANGERQALQRVVRRATRVTSVASLAGAGVMLVWSRQLLGLFGAEFVVGAVALWVLVLGQVVNAAAGPAILLLNMTGHQRSSARILAASAILNLVLNAILIPFFGYLGAALATTTTMIIWNILAVVAVWRKLRIGSTAVWLGGSHA